MTNSYNPTKWVEYKTVATANVMNNIEKGIVDAHEKLSEVDSQIRDIEANKVDNSNYIKLVAVKTDNGGDCTILKFPNGKSMIIDTLIESELSNILNVLNDENIDKLDYVFLSHYHIDHCGCVTSLDNYIDSNTVFILPPKLLDTGKIGSDIIKNENDILEFISLKDCRVIRPEENQAINIGNAKLKFLNTDHNIYYNCDVFNYNNLSLCCILQYGLKKCFFSGDIATDAQDYLKYSLEKVDLYKAHHHASDFFQNSEYMLTIKPDIIFGCCGTGYSKLVYTRAFTDLVTGYGSSFYSTSENGNIEMKMYEGRIDIKAKAVKSFNKIISIETVIGSKILYQNYEDITLNDIISNIPYQTDFDFTVKPNEFPNVLPSEYKSSSYRFYGRKSYNDWYSITVEDLTNLTKFYIHVKNNIPSILHSDKITIKTGNTTNSNSHVVTYDKGYSNELVIGDNTIKGLTRYNRIVVSLKCVDRTEKIVKVNVLGHNINFYHNSLGTDDTLTYCFILEKTPFTFANTYDIFLNNTPNTVINAVITIEQV